MKIDFALELAPLDSGDMDLVRAWRNSYAIWRWTRQNDLISDVHQMGWFERQSADATIRMWKIVARVDRIRTAVGVCGLTSIDPWNRRAEFSLYIAPEHHRKGYGTMALKILLQHAFQNVGLDQVWGESFDGNPAIKIFESVGFRRDGTRRRWQWKDGSFHDAHLYSILREEWLASLANNHHHAAGAPGAALNRDPGASRAEAG